MSNEKEISIKVKVRPFMVPNNVVVVPDGPTSRSEEPGTIPLKDIDAVTLNDMCEEFVQAVFSKAGKQRTPQVREQ